MHKCHTREQEYQVDYFTRNYLLLYWIYNYKGKGEGKGHPIKGHERPEVE